MHPCAKSAVCVAVTCALASCTPREHDAGTATAGAPAPTSATAAPAFTPPPSASVSAAPPASAAPTPAEWAWLDGPSALGTTLTGPRLGERNLWLTLPSGFSASLWHAGYTTRTEGIYLASNAASAPPTARLYLSDLPTPRAQLDAAIKGFLWTRGAGFADVVWPPRRRAAVGPSHLEVEVAEGRREGSGSTFLQLVFALPDEKAQWIVVELDAAIAAPTREAVRAALRSVVRK